MAGRKSNDLQVYTGQLWETWPAAAPFPRNAGLAGGQDGELLGSVGSETGQWGRPELSARSARLSLPDLAWGTDTVTEFNHVAQTWADS